MPDTIRYGSRGDDVVLCQTRLNTKGFICGIDGIFGSDTQRKVEQFQAASSLVVDGIVGPATWNVLLQDDSSGIIFSAPEPLPPVIRRAKSLGHTVWGDPWRLWLFGVRSATRKAGKFDDMLGCCYVNEDGIWTAHYWPGTTDPGDYYLENPMNSKGCAILVPEQYLDTWTIDLHRGEYRALCQRAGEVAVYRDDNRDDTLDTSGMPIDIGYFGIDIHASTRIAGEVRTDVSTWSAGCQVHASANGFAMMMDLADSQVEKTGRSTFSYTLMDQWW
jgi:peptidoglycan hydrolase-like protein with peptidoglycan-binding domain